MDYVAACIDEVAVEGLDGITLSALWIRLEQRIPEFPLTLDEKVRNFLWTNVLSCNEELMFFELETPRPQLVLFDRTKYVDPTFDIIVEQKDQPDDIYPIFHVVDKEHGIIGSCSSYNTRIDVTDQIRRIANLSDVQKRWNNKLVIVASQRLRTAALFGYDSFDIFALSDREYMFMERIARSRFHGEITSGANGLTKIFKLSPKTVFYILKRLKHHHLITVQPFFFKTLSGANQTCKLIHIMRFYVSHQPAIAVRLEKLSAYLLQLPQHRTTLNDIHANLGFGKHALANLFTYGQGYIAREIVSCSELHPEQQKKQSNNKSSASGRSKTVVKLLKPFKPNSEQQPLFTGNVDEAESDDDQEDGNDNSDDDGNDNNRLMTGEVNVLSEEGKTTSASASSFQTGVVYELPVLHQVYQHILAASNKGATIADIARRFGLRLLDARQLTKNLCRKGCIVFELDNEGRQLFQRCVAVQPATNGLKEPCDSDSTKHPQKKSASKSDKKASLKNDSAKKNVQQVSALKLSRMQMVMNFVQSAKIITDVCLIRQKLTASEEKAAYVIDSKSVDRLINTLHAEKKLNVYCKSVELPDGSRKEKKFICDIDVTEDHPLVLAALNTMTQKLVASTAAKTRRQLITSGEESVGAAPDLNEKSDAGELEVTYDLDTKPRYGFLPRFQRMRTLHMLLWCFVYGKKERPVEDPQEAATLPAWYKEVKPLPTHGYPDGWCCIGDIVSSMPLQLFCQIVRIMHKVDRIEEYLNDQNTCYITFENLPLGLRRFLADKRKHLYKVEETCYRLSELGLLSFGKIDLKQKEQIFVYVHRNASFKETSQALVTDPDIPVRRFTFDSWQCVDQYWNELAIECLNSPSEHHHGKNVCQKFNYKEVFANDGCHRGKEIGEIEDNGRIPGDGVGAAGLDSLLFSHLGRNWGTFNKMINSVAIVCHKTASKSTISGECSVDASSVQGAEGSANKEPKSCLMKPNRGGRGIKRKRPTASSDSCEPEVKKKYKYKKKPSDEVKERENRIKDLAAKKRMRLQRVSWSQEEDSLLLLMGVTSQFLTGKANFCLYVQSHMLRDLLHANIHTSLDKTSRACQRRFLYMIKRPETKQNMNLYLSEALVDKELVSEFENRKLDIRTVKYTPDVESLFKHCFKKLLHKFSNRSHLEMFVSLPETYSELLAQYTIQSVASANEATRYSDPQSLDEIYVAVLKNFIHSAMLANDKTSRVYELYKVCQSYPVNLVEEAFKSFTQDKVITKLKSYLAKTLKAAQKFGSVGTYKIAQRYWYKWKSWHPDSVFEHAAKVLTEVVDVSSKSDWLTFENTSGASCVAVTLIAQNKLSVKVVVPENIVVFDTVKTNKDFEAVQRQQRKTMAAAAGDDDSDAEEERMIDEADRERAATDAAQQNAADANVSVAETSTSRSVLWLYKCQYIHSAKLSVKQANVYENLFINTCNIQGQLSNSIQQAQTPSKLAVSDEVLAQLVFSQWNQSHTLLHPQTRSVILNTIRKLVRQDNIQDLCQSSSSGLDGTQCALSVGSEEQSRNTGPSDGSVLILDLNNFIQSSGIFGVDERQLKTAFPAVDSLTIKCALCFLCSSQLVLRVGISQFRYVSRCHVQCWLVTIEKNVKGRGTASADTKTEKNLTDLPDNFQSFYTDYVQLATSYVEDNDKSISRDGSCCSKTAAISTVVLQHSQLANSSERSGCDGEPSLSADVIESLTGDVSQNRSKTKRQRVVDQTTDISLHMQPDVSRTVEPSDSAKSVVSELQSSLRPHESGLVITSKSAATSAAISASISTSTPSSSNGNLAQTLTAAAEVESAFPEQTDLSQRCVVSNSATNPVSLSTQKTDCSDEQKSDDGCSAAATSSKHVSSAITSAVDSSPSTGTKRFLPLSPPAVTRRRAVASELSENERETPSIVQPPPPPEAPPPATEAPPPATEAPPPATATHGSPPKVILAIADLSTWPAGVTGLHIASPVAGQQKSHVVPGSSLLPHQHLIQSHQLNAACTSQIPVPLRLPLPSHQNVITLPATGTSLPRPNLHQQVMSTSVCNVQQLPVRNLVNLAASPKQTLPGQPVAIHRPRVSLPSGHLATAAAATAAGPVRIRIDASQLAGNSESSSYSIANRIQQILSQNCNVRPGVPIRIRFVQPVAAAATTTALDPAACNMSALSSGSHNNNTAPQTLSSTASNAMAVVSPCTVATTGDKTLVCQSSSVVTCQSNADAADSSRIPQLDGVADVDERRDAIVRELAKDVCSTSKSADCRTNHLRSRIYDSAKRKARCVDLTDANVSLEFCERITQLDGMVDDDDDDDDDVADDGTKTPTERLRQTSPSHRNVIQNERDNSVDLASAGRHQQDGNVFRTSPRSSRILQKQQQQQPQPRPTSDDGNLVKRTSTYKTVQLVPRPWRTPEGTVNHASLATMLKGILIHVMENPGITVSGLTAKYETVLQPVALLELLEMLESLGCVYRKSFKRLTKPALFTKRPVISEAAEVMIGSSHVYQPTVDCILKLGQFLQKL